MSEKKIVVRVTTDLHEMVTEVAGDREVTFPEALGIVIRAGYSRVKALDRHAIVKRAPKKATRAAPTRRTR